ncbi:hypothetical protein M501DRAFT_1054330 [Patellaria atrata CBS 101060]|uniref:Uncharacterized protein n=1 Tax=Patellaria atrata CBS 101060 TaxID=1346257 RepID=A0A9P4VW07_9PEZI|nr:hypothetical protein M501DRAFT_1054330 [Patellaria atrata CBS 101060]
MVPPLYIAESRICYLSSVPVTLFATLSVLAIIQVGQFTIFITVGSAIFAIGAGLLYTLNIDTSLAKALGHQVILGVGQGLAIQIPVITGQAFSNTEDIAAATATVLFFQMMGGTVFVSAGQSVFSNRLIYSLGQVALHLDKELVSPQMLPSFELSFLIPTLLRYCGRT